MRKLLTLLLIAVSFFIGCDEVDMEAEQLKKDIELIEDYLEENNLIAQSTESGLHYIIDEEGNGSNPTITSYVTVSYTGKLLDGTIFDEGEIVNSQLSNYIKGWQEGIPLFQEGGRGKLLIPSKLGYGKFPVNSIPSYSVLIFDIYLQDVR